jgi:hypothetical protein
MLLKQGMLYTYSHLYTGWTLPKLLDQNFSLTIYFGAQSNITLVENSQIPDQNAMSH